MDNVLSEFDEVTAVVSGELSNQEKLLSVRYIITLMKKGSKPFIYKPDKVKLTVGRSSKCDFQIEDPYFPRNAAEIILDPTPLLRLQDSSDETKQIQHIKPGSKVNLYGYRLYLMNEGDVIKNQYRNRQSDNATKNTLFQLLVPVFLLLILAVKYFYLNGTPEVSSKKIAEEPIPAKLLSSPQSVVKSIIKTPTDQLVEAENPVLRKTGLQLKINTSQNDKSAYKKRSPGRIRSSATSSPVKSSIDESFEKALLQAEIKISNGDISGATQLMKPYLPLLAARQRKRIVEILDPHAEKIFRRAYILKAFDRETSNRMLNNLSISGLDFLPSVKKAKLHMEP